MKKSSIFTKGRKARATENVSPLIRMLKCCGMSAGIALLAAFASLTVGGLIGYSLRDPIKSIAPVSMFSLFASFFFCGFVSSKLERGKPIITGLLSAAAYLSFIIVVSLALKPSQGSIGASIPLIALTLPCSAIGAFIGNIRIPKRRSIYHTRKK